MNNFADSLTNSTFKDIFPVENCPSVSLVLSRPGGLEAFVGLMTHLQNIKRRLRGSAREELLSSMCSAGIGFHDAMRIMFELTPTTGHHEDIIESNKSLYRPIEGRKLNRAVLRYKEVSSNV